MILPLLHRLARIAGKNGEIPKDVIAAACKDYECEMIPRAFKWVGASGRLNSVVSAVVSSSITNVLNPRCRLIQILFQVD